MHYTGIYCDLCGQIKGSARIVNDELMWSCYIAIVKARTYYTAPLWRSRNRRSDLLVTDNVSALLYLWHEGCGLKADTALGFASRLHPSCRKLRKASRTHIINYIVNYTL